MQKFIPLHYELYRKSRFEPFLFNPNITIIYRMLAVPNYYNAQTKDKFEKNIYINLNLHFN